MFPIRTLIADDHPGMCAGVATLLSSEPEIEIVGTPIEQVSSSFRPHPRYRQMLEWKSAEPASGPLSGILRALDWVQR